ncbi:hypothetical protein LINGRAHAP2_LOCUS34441, partial [Linum grandiflorum]
ERPILAISARSRTSLARGTRGVHSGSSFNHDIGGIVESGNKHLLHVQWRVHINS